MAHRQRWYLTGVVYDVVIRTLHGRFWLRPDAACKRILEELCRRFPAGAIVRLAAYVPAKVGAPWPWTLGPSDADAFRRRT